MNLTNSKEKKSIITKILKIKRRNKINKKIGYESFDFTKARYLLMRKQQLKLLT